jgi:hypothetical protein
MTVGAVLEYPRMDVDIELPLRKWIPVLLVPQSPQPTKLMFPADAHERCPTSASRTHAFSVALPAVSQHTWTSRCGHNAVDR